MDLWIVAAATGAGYLAKYWQNQARDEDALSQSVFGDASLVSSQHPNHLLNKLAGGKKRFEDVFAHGRIEEISSDENPFDAPFATELATMGGFENERLGILPSCQNLNVFSLPNTPPKFCINKKSEEHIGGSRVVGKMTDDFGISPCDSSRRVSYLYDNERNRITSKPRSSNRDVITPLNYALAQHSIPSPEFRPFSESTEGQIIIGSEASLLCSWPKGSHFDDIENISADSPTPGTIKNTSGQRSERISRSSKKLNKREHFTSRGSPDESFILHLGVFVGMLSSFISNKREVQKLKELLKQTETLVEDLQEELKMKDSLKGKEFSEDNCESQYTFSNNGFSEKTEDQSSTKHVVDYSMNFDVRELYERKPGESSESMSRIEAELEAELERLGLNVSTHSMERFSGIDELDQEFIEDFAEGELRTDMISGQNYTKTKSNQEGSESTTQSGNYAVSPRELTLRLHDVVQTRLEARVKELEIALQDNQRKLQLMNTEYKNSFAIDELQPFSNEKSPAAKDECKIVTSLEYS